MYISAHPTHQLWDWFTHCTCIPIFSWCILMQIHVQTFYVRMQVYARLLIVCSTVNVNMDTVDYIVRLLLVCTCMIMYSSKGPVCKQTKTKHFLLLGDDISNIHLNLSILWCYNFSKTRLFPKWMYILHEMTIYIIMCFHDVCLKYKITTNCKKVLIFFFKYVSCLLKYRKTLAFLFIYFSWFIWRFGASAV